MLAVDEDALICDLAEQYGIYDWRSLPLTTVAALSAGLRDNARIKMKISGARIDSETMMLAAITDRLGMLVWMQSRDGAKGKNRPKSILAEILQKGQTESDIQSYTTPEEFEAARRRILEDGD